MQIIIYAVVTLIIRGGISFSPSALRSPFRWDKTNTSRTLTTLHVDKNNDINSLSQAQIEAIKLKAQAAQLRAEAEKLEAEQAERRAAQTEALFQAFDLNQNGVLDSSELREGLEKVLKQTISIETAEKVLNELDSNDNGVIELSELPNITNLSRLVEDIVEKLRLEAQTAKIEAQKAAAEAKLREEYAALVNDKPATPVDRILGCLPYLLPFIDSLDYGSFLLKGQIDTGNLVAIGAFVVLGLFRSIPLGQFALFLGLNILGDRLDINKLIRFNAIQAIYIDIALFPASIFLALLALPNDNASVSIGPSQLFQYSSTAVFSVIALIVSYSIVSTLLGETPNKLPFISNAVQTRIDRMSAREFFNKRKDETDDESK